MQKNPFDLPNMGFNHENPLFTSMNMMRQMWESMGTDKMGMSSPSSVIPSAEDLDKRIKELKTVENWLRLNLSMLSSTIQGLEVQHSTLSTFQSFAQSGLAAMPGLAEAMATATMQSPNQSESTKSSEGKTQEMSQTTAETSSKSEPKEKKAEDSAEHLLQAGQAWWGLMQEQFETLAKATAQSMQQAQSTASPFTAAMENPSADTTFTKTGSAKKVAKTTATSAGAAKKATKTTKAAKKATKKSTTTKAAKKTPPPTK